MKKRLFTLIELIIVIVIVGILASIVIPNINGIKSKAEKTALFTNKVNVQTAVDIYSYKNGGSLPVNYIPEVGLPQSIDKNKLAPADLREFPEDAYYWVDYKGEVFNSKADSPFIISKNSGTISWAKVKNAVSYNIYEISNGVTGSLNKVSVHFLKEQNETSFNGDDDKKYLISSNDRHGLESAPVGENYTGHVENPDINSIKSCSDIKELNPNAKDGLYLITPIENEDTIKVYCDMETDGGGWTLVWNNLRDRTGNPVTGIEWEKAINTKPIFGSSSLNEDKEDFLVYTGLEYWNKILGYEEGEIMYLWSHDYGKPIDQGFKANLQPFKSSEEYTLKMSNYNQLFGEREAGIYSYHNNSKFSTIDHRNDTHNGSGCSVRYTDTPFWYEACWKGSINGGGEGSGYGHYNGAFWYHEHKEWGEPSGRGAGNGWIFIR